MVAKKKMGYPRPAKVPRCPAKARGKKRRFEEAGDFSHSPNTHFCSECACGRPAGYGTNHYGWGFCKSHEAEIGKEQAAKFAEDHLQALQTRTPFAYKDVSKWLQGVQYDAEDAMAVLNLRSEIDVIRASLQEVLERCRVDQSEVKPYEAALLQIADSVKGGVDPDQAKLILKALDEVKVGLARASGTLTESGRGGTQPMSDATRIELVRKLADTVARISKSKFDIDANKFITVDELKAFVGMVVSHSKRILKDPKLFQDWAEAMSKIPSPRVIGGQTHAEDYRDVK